MSAVLRGNLRMALSGIRSSRWRSFLTMLGIIVGIVSVVTVVGIGTGIKQQIAGTLGHYGKDLIIVRPPQPAKGNPAGLGQTDVLFGMQTTMSLSAADADLVHRTPGVGMSTPLGVVPGSLEIDGQIVKGTKIVSAGGDTADILKQNLAYGDFWTDKEEGSHFAVLGKQAAYDLFSDPAPLGKSFIFRGQSFQVRGVFASFAKIPFSPTGDFDRAIFVPYQTAGRLTNNATGPYVILAKPAPGEQLKGTIGSIEDGLTKAHGGEQDFSVLDANKSLESGDGVIQLLQMWIVAVAIISLLMGGVGIMNIMLLVVTERMHEIGVRKAVGASSRQILGQFVLEATVLSVAGGVIGIIVSTGAIGLLRLYTDLRPVISWYAVGIAAGVSIVIGIVFGAIPAIKAARKDPIEALRHE